jgi:hypothetical protein
MPLQKSGKALIVFGALALPLLFLTSGCGSPKINQTSSQIKTTPTPSTTEKSKSENEAIQKSLQQYINETAEELSIGLVLVDGVAFSKDQFNITKQVEQKINGLPLSPLDGQLGYVSDQNGSKHITGVVDLRYLADRNKAALLKKVPTPSTGKVSIGEIVIK